MKKLFIIQHYVPEYRAPFFDALTDRLGSEYGIECQVLAGSPEGAQGSRGDAVVDAPWLIKAGFRTLGLGDRSIHLGVSSRHWKKADGVIVGLMGSSLNAYQALAARQVKGLRVGVWGHIKQYVNPGNPIDLAVERALMRHSDHVFAYTPGGTRYALEAGVDESMITTVMNSVPTDRLIAERDAITSSDVDDFRSRLGIEPNAPLLGVIGGIDSSKRIEFLADALDLLYQIDPTVRVVVCGKGNQEQLLSVAEARSQVVSVGYAGPRIKSLVAASSRALLNPGRIGLIAVDALVLGVPILTTRWQFHAPEVEYLTEGLSMHTSADTVQDFVHEILRTIEAPPKELRGLPFPTLGGMVDNFCRGVGRMMS